MDKYQKKSMLGSGSYGAAYLVELRRDRSKLFVIKEVTVGHLSEKDRMSAQQEAEVLSQMHHSNVVSYIESFVEGSKLYIVMDYADGGDLSKAIEKRRTRGRPFTEVEVMNVFVQLGLGLRHVHSNKILHRDLKAQNIFLTSVGVVKVGDFGISKRMDSSLDLARTQIGTPYYISSEIWEGKPYGKKSDVWSLGVILYELMTLDVPFKASSLPALIQKIVSAAPAPPPSTYSKDLQSLVLSLLNKDPSQRPTITQVLKSPYLQAYISMQISHTMTRGVGGGDADPAPEHEEAALQEQAPPAHVQQLADGGGERRDGEQVRVVVAETKEAVMAAEDKVVEYRLAVQGCQEEQKARYVLDARAEALARQREQERMSDMLRREYFLRQEMARANRMRVEGDMFGHAYVAHRHGQPPQRRSSSPEQALAADRWSGRDRERGSPPSKGADAPALEMMAAEEAARNRAMAAVFKQRIEEELYGRAVRNQSQRSPDVDPEERVNQLKQASALEKQKAIARHEQELLAAHRAVAEEKRRLYEKMQQRRAFEDERDANGHHGDGVAVGSPSYIRADPQADFEAKGGGLSGVDEGDVRSVMAKERTKREAEERRQAELAMALEENRQARRELRAKVAAHVMEACGGPSAGAVPRRRPSPSEVAGLCERGVDGEKASEGRGGQMQEQEQVDYEEDVQLVNAEKERAKKEAEEKRQAELAAALEEKRRARRELRDKVTAAALEHDDSPLTQNELPQLPSPPHGVALVDECCGGHKCDDPEDEAEQEGSEVKGDCGEARPRQARSEPKAERERAKREAEAKRQAELAEAYTEQRLARGELRAKVAAAVQHGDLPEPLSPASSPPPTVDLRDEAAAVTVDETKSSDLGEEGVIPQLSPPSALSVLPETQRSSHLPQGPPPPPPNHKMSDERDDDESAAEKGAAPKKRRWMMWRRASSDETAVSSTAEKSDGWRGLFFGGARRKQRDKDEKDQDGAVVDGGPQPGDSPEEESDAQTIAGGEEPYHAESDKVSHGQAPPSADVVQLHEHLVSALCIADDDEEDKPGDIC